MEIKEAVAELEKESGQEVAQQVSGLHIKIDRELCQGHATCMAEAPELFKVDDAGNVTVLQENPSQDLLTKAQQAEKYCPTKAISIELK